MTATTARAPDAIPVPLMTYRSDADYLRHQGASPPPADVPQEDEPEDINDSLAEAGHKDQ